MTYETKRIHIDGYGIHYLEAGSGPTVVLNHGFGAWSEGTWRATIEDLSRDFHVLAPDMVGFGYSDKPQLGFYDLDDILRAPARILARFLDGVGVDKAAMVGMSLGGGISLRFALDYPERVRALGVVSSYGLGRSIHPFYRTLAIPALAERIWTNPKPAQVRAFMKGIVQDTGCLDDAFLEEQCAILALPGSRHVVCAARHAVSLAGQRVSYLEALPRIRAPTLVVWGENDKVFPVRHGRRAERIIPNSRLVVIPNCGHVPPIECPGAFVGALRPFLEEALLAGREGGRDEAETPLGEA